MATLKIRSVIEAELSPTAKVLYFYLYFSHSPHGFICNKSVISQDIKVSQNEVVTATQELIDERLISVKDYQISGFQIYKTS